MNKDIFKELGILSNIFEDNDDYISKIKDKDFYEMVEHFSSLLNDLDSTLHYAIQDVETADDDDTDMVSKDVANDGKEFVGLFKEMKKHTEDAKSVIGKLDGKE